MRVCLNAFVLLNVLVLVSVLVRMSVLVLLNVLVLMNVHVAMNVLTSPPAQDECVLTQGRRRELRVRRRAARMFFSDPHISKG